jgi:hypothetical protein
VPYVPGAAIGGASFARLSATISCKNVQWRATVDEDGQYSFAIALCCTRRS